MRTARLVPLLLTTAAALCAFMALGTGHVAHATDVVVASNATLNGDAGGSFAVHTTALTACKDYTLRLTYTMAQGGTPAENGIGVEIWNNEGSAYQTSLPFGERVLNAPTNTYYLRSVRTAANPFVEEIRFKVGQPLTVSPWCSDMTPNYTFRVFNYLTGNALSYTLSLPGGDEN